LSANGEQPKIFGASGDAPSRLISLLLAGFTFVDTDLESVDKLIGKL